MSRRIHVLQFVTSFHTGGTERQFVNLVQGLSGTDFQVHLACFHALGDLQDELRGRDFPLIELRVPSLMSGTVARRLLTLVRYLRRHRIDVVHTTGLYPNLLGVLAAWIARTPAIIASVRDMGHMWSPALRRAQRHACRLADVVVVNADAVADRLRAEGYDPARIEVIKNGVLPAPAPDPAAAAAVRAELGIPGNVPVVGMVCRIDPVKGLPHFIDAAARVASRHPETRFVIVGGPCAGFGEAYTRELLRSAAAIGLGDRLILTGRRSDVSAILPTFTVSVLASLSEGLSNTVLESMAAARPVVATRVGGNAELVKDGVTGLLVPPGDPEALAAAIVRLIEAPALAAEMGMAGQRTIESRFTCRRMTEETAGLYRRLLARAALRKRPLPAFGKPEVGRP